MTNSERDQLLGTPVRQRRPLTATEAKAIGGQYGLMCGLFGALIIYLAGFVTTLLLGGETLIDAALWIVEKDLQKFVLILMASLSVFSLLFGRQAG